MNSLQAVHATGRRLSEATTGAKVGQGDFAHLAAAILGDAYLHEDVRLDKLAVEVGRADRLEHQFDLAATFGDPPITLYIDPDHLFFIAAYLWIEPDMAIHDHSFEGAFSVLGGHSDHQTFSFSGDTEIDDLAFGELSLEESDVLRPGDVRRIEYGDAFIHRNVHNASPTLTLVARTLGRSRTQKHYLEAGVSVDSTLEASGTRRMQLYRSLLRTDSVLALQMLSQMIVGPSKAGEILRALQILYEATGSQELVHSTHRLLDAKFGKDEASQILTAVTRAKHNLDTAFAEHS